MPWPGMKSAIFHATLLALARFTSPNPHLPLGERDDSSSNSGSRLPSIPEEGPQRGVYVSSTNFLLTHTMDPVTGDDLMESTFAVYVEGTNQEGPLLIEIAKDVDGKSPIIRTVEGDVKDPKATLEGSVPGGAARMRVLQGTTKLTNAAFMDPVTGEGVVADVWSKDPIYRRKPGEVPGNTLQGENTGNNLVKNIVGRLNIKLSSATAQVSYLTERIELTTAQIKPQVVRVTKLVHQVAGEKESTIFDVDNLGHGSTTTSSSSGMEDNPWDFDPNDDPLFKGGQSLTPGDDPKTGTTDEIQPAPLPEDTPERPAAPAPKPFEGELSVAARKSFALGSVGRVIFSTPFQVGGAVTGIAGALVSVAFIIMDFIHGNWVGAAISTVGLAIGAAALMIDILTEAFNPLAWIVAGFISFFAILPGMFEEQKKIPRSDDAQAIVQWSFFGDAGHTGLERCRASNATYHGNPNCTIAYGPAVFAKSLKVDIFDIIAFFIQYNHGLAMTIEDFAGQLVIVDPTHRDQSRDSIATIDCGNRLPAYDNGGDFDDPDADSCPHPKYHINLSQIVIPGVNQTADKVRQRIIPAPNGDCKLVTFPGAQDFPAYNLSVTGLPSAISCNVSASLNVSGVAFAADSNGQVDLSGNGHSSNGQNVSLVSPGASSSDGATGDSRAPPLQTGFLPIFNASTSVCLADSKNNQLCLPPGTYGPSTGLFGISSAITNGLTLPPSVGATLEIHYTWPPEPFSQTLQIHHNYTNSITPQKPNAGFIYDMQTIMPGHIDRLSNAGVTVYYPSCHSNSSCSAVTSEYFCLFSGLKYTGDVLCLGLGGGMLPTNWRKKALSVRVPPGIGYEMFAQNYADAGGARLSGSTEDLTDTPYGTGGSFARNVVAMWAFKLS